MEYIVNAFSLLINVISRFFGICRSVFQSILDLFSGIIHIIQTLWFGLKTLFTGLWSLIVQVLDGTVFGYVGDAFNTLSSYIGTTGTLFIAGLLFIIMVRIIVAFVFSGLRLNLSYKNKDK